MTPSVPAPAGEAPAGLEEREAAFLRAEWFALENEPRENPQHHAVAYRSLAKRLLGLVERLTAVGASGAPGRDAPSEGLIAELRARPQIGPDYMAKISCAELNELLALVSRGLPAAPPEIQDEIAWLVEGQGDGRPVWWTGKWWPRFATIVHGPLHSTHAIPRSTDDMEPIFSPEHAEAIRFARKEDAERAIGLLPAFYRAAVKASEHMWGARTALGEGRPE